MISIARNLGRVALPAYTGARVQMMPFRVHDVFTSLPAELQGWAPLVAQVCARAGESGVGFLTIDEAFVRSGEHHRRPGLHVDCGGPLLAHGGSPPPAPKHGGSPPAPKSNHGASGGLGGMYVVASHLGSRGWLGEFAGDQEHDGDCSHLAGRLGVALPLGAGDLFWCNHTFVHETTPLNEDCYRQFLRISMPSAAPWHSNYTPNPLGVTPTGSIAEPRTEMRYREN